MRWAKGAGFLVLALALTLILNMSLGPLPAILPLLNPGQGVWTEAGQAVSPTSGSLTLPGLIAPVEVTYTTGGVPHIFARNDHDLFMVQGYLVARDRLFEMDLMRRQASGSLSAILGPSYVAADKAELSLGLLVGARRTMAVMEQSATGKAALADMSAYAQGVNALIRQDEAAGTLPVYFKLVGYHPAPWTAFDSLLVQEDLEQVLALSTGPLDVSILASHVGTRKALQLVPVLPPNPQLPYDPGPYPPSSPAPLPADVVTAAQATAAGAASGLIAQAKPLLPGIAQGFEMSNNWAVSGSLTASGKPLLAGDPHLSLTLPSIWYEMQLVDPNYHVEGVNFPGAPGIVIGHNQAAAWSATDTENQAVFDYIEKTSAAHPGRYEFNGSWRPFTVRHYTIAVKGKRPVSYTVDWTNNGPILDQYGVKIAMRWTGDYASQDLVALLAMDRATSLSEFEQALSVWSCPVQNWVFADTHGDIALMAPGFYPLVSHGNPELLLDGSGPDQWTGRIPANAQPRIVNPPWGFVWSANQRVVGATYPYDIGQSDDFANGYRADTIHAFLSNPANRPFTVASMERLQADNQDHLALLLAPDIAAAGARLGLTGNVATAVERVGSWNGTMDTGSVSATIYWYFLGAYLQATFGPWWQADKVPVATDPNLAISPENSPLVEDLQVFTASGQSPWFNNPVTGQTRTAADVMDTALAKALGQIERTYGQNPAHWAWGRVHTRTFNSLAGLAVLSRGPYATGGDINTPDAASPTTPTSTSGPSWRMVVDLSNLANSVGVYPGGQSENPLSAHYADGLPTWLSYQNRPLVDLAAPSAQHLTFQP